MKRIVLALAGILFAAGAAWADYEKGLAAYLKGDYETAFREWQEAAARGDDVAQNSLGGLYYRGQGVRADKIQAYFWSAIAAERGNASAIRNRDRVANEIPMDELLRTKRKVSEWKPAGQ